MTVLSNDLLAKLAVTENTVLSLILAGGNVILYSYDLNGLNNAKKANLLTTEKLVFYSQILMVLIMAFCLIYYSVKVSHNWRAGFYISSVLSILLGLAYVALVLKDKYKVSTVFIN